MNPAALKADLQRLEQGGTLIVNTDAFDERNLEKAEYASNPLDDGTVTGYRVLRVPMTSLTKDACEPHGVKRDAERSKNFALGLVSFMYSRPTEPTLEWFSRSSQRTNRSLLRTLRHLRWASTSAKQPRWLDNAMKSSQRPFHPANIRRSPVTPLFRGGSSQPANLTCRSPSGHTRSPSE